MRRLLLSLVLCAPALAHAAPVAIARCGDSTLDLTVDGPTGTLRAVIASGGVRWTLTGHVSLSRLGNRTRTIAIEDLKTVERTPDGKTPAGLVFDAFLDDKKLILRHAAEGDPDIDYAADLDKCTFSGDAALTALVPPPSEPPGCAPAIVKASYRTQVTRVAKLPAGEIDREAQLLCEDHQKTIAARARLEAAISDRTAKDRQKARGAQLLKVEDNRIKAWNRMDACLAADPGTLTGMAALLEAEVKERACYARIAAKT